MSAEDGRVEPNETPEQRAERLSKMRPGRNGAGRLVAPWRKGMKSPNPSGRPTTSSILRPFLEALAANRDGHDQGAIAREFKDLLIKSIRKGDLRRVQAILAVMERTDGPIEKKIEVSRVQAPPVLVIDATEVEAKQLQEGFGGSG